MPRDDRMRKRSLISILMTLSACTVFGAVQPVTFPYRPGIDPSSLPITADIDTETDSDPLTDAIVSDDIDKIIALIDSGADINKTTMIDGIKKTYANTAWEKGLDAVAEDLALRMDERAVKESVIYASAIGDFAFIDMIGTLGYETISPDILLDIAGIKLDAETLSGLIERGADINAKDRWGNTPLHEAARNGAIGNIGLFLDNGAVPDIINGRFETPMAAAVVDGKTASVRALQDRGIEVNVSTVRAIEKLKVRNAGNTTDEWLHNTLPFLDELVNEYERGQALQNEAEGNDSIIADSNVQEERETAPEDIQEPSETKSIDTISHSG